MTTAESNEILAKQYQEEIERALKRYSRALDYAEHPPEVPVGQSPKEVIWTRNKAKLYHYVPTVEKRHNIPILMIYALINKPYILDLRPGSSLVEYLLGQGFEIYLLDWGTPGPEDRNLKIDDYVLDYMPRAVKHTLLHSGAKEVSLLGYCIGAVLTVTFAALHSELPLKNLILMAAPLDFSEQGLLRTWLDPQNFDVDQLASAYGLIPAEMVDFGSKMLKPVNNFVLTYSSFFDKLWDDRAVESWLSMQKWVNDGVPFSSEAFKQWIKDFYLGNKLTTGQLYLRGQRVNLSKIKSNLLNIIAEKDHIALPSQSKPIMNLVSSPDKEQLILPGGHVGLVVGRNATKGLWPALSAWMSKRSDS
ncbi:MAG: class III poly(R)-hydroxyalkanoic acid synthase subunit PhaC [Chloroflexi bacterium]|nr:class III poly(R)-hydroxyalkanoic acid synthase subunit PhaC [Chloroflexota bacterium]